MNVEPRGSPVFTCVRYVRRRKMEWSSVETLTSFRQMEWIFFSLYLRRKCQSCYASLWVLIGYSKICPVKSVKGHEHVWLDGSIRNRVVRVISKKPAVHFNWLALQLGHCTVRLSEGSASTKKDDVKQSTWTDVLYASCTFSLYDSGNCLSDFWSRSSVHVLDVQCH